MMLVKGLLITFAPINKYFVPIPSSPVALLQYNY